MAVCLPPLFTKSSASHSKLIIGSSSSSSSVPEPQLLEVLINSHIPTYAAVQVNRRGQHCALI